MRTLEVVYSPLCEATGAMLGKLGEWLAATDVQISAFPFDRCPPRLKSAFSAGESCFIDVFYEGKRIDSVPLHRDKIETALGIQRSGAGGEPDGGSAPPLLTTGAALAEEVRAGGVTFHPITPDTYAEEMSMCLCNYPVGNPPERFHEACRAVKSRVFSEVWALENAAGIYAKYRGTVIGLLEVMPREIMKKYGYMTGTTGEDATTLSVGCYEVGFGIPRVEMIDLLMCRLETAFPLFRRRRLEGVGIKGWDDGFNPYWVYQKYGFEETETLAENTVVFTKMIST